jgi:hypothetical protein
MKKYEEFTSSYNDHGHIYGFTISIPEEEEPRVGSDHMDSRNQ